MFVSIALQHKRQLNQYLVVYASKEYKCSYNMDQTNVLSSEEQFD